MNRPLNIKVAEAAVLMEKGQLFVREGMRLGELNLGTAMVMPGSKRWNFRISTPLLAEYLGVSVEDLTEMVMEMREKREAMA